jgi:hypothetical protein
VREGGRGGGVSAVKTDGVSHGARAESSVCFFFEGTANSPQNRGGWLGIEGEGVAVECIPVGIGVDFQFRIPNHPNSRYLNLPMLIPNSKAEYLHPNAV